MFHAIVLWVIVTMAHTHPVQDYQGPCLHGYFVTMTHAHHSFIMHETCVQ